MSNDTLEKIEYIMKTGKYSQGEYVEQFEEAIGKYLGVKKENVVVVSSGTAALYLAFILSPEVDFSVPAITFISTFTSGFHASKYMTILDVDLDTWNSSCATIGVDLYGNPINYHPVIEDAAEALGSISSSGERCGTLGEIGILSFFENKIITSGGEGGALVFKDSELAAKARLMRQQGKDFTMKSHQLMGFNYRMTEIQAAIGLKQFKNIDKILETRRRHDKIYRKNLSLQFQKINGTSNCWFTPVLTKNKQELIKEFIKRKIPFRDVFYPLYAEPIIKMIHKTGVYPNSKLIYNKGICLPTHESLSDDYILKICEVVKKYG